MSDMHRVPTRQAMQTDFWWRSDCNADVQSMCNILAAEREREVCAESMYCGLIVSMQSSRLYIPAFLSLCKATISQAQAPSARRFDLGSNRPDFDSEASYLG